MGSNISSTPPPAVRATSQTASTEQTAAWQGAVDSAVERMNGPEVKGSLQYLGEGRIDKFKDKVKTDMEAFVAANPNATPAEIKAEAEKTTSKHEMNAVFEKMRDDNFFNKLMNRRKELIKDMWG